MIAQAVEQIRNTVSLSVLDESATKQGVVLRLLRLAGWDTFDVSQVVPEYTVGNRRVDYALRPGSPRRRIHRGQAPRRKSGKTSTAAAGVLLSGRGEAGGLDQRADLVALSAPAGGELGTETVPDHRPRGAGTQRRGTPVPGVPFSERVGSGQAVGDAEDLVKSQQRAEIIVKTIAAAWTQIVETPMNSWLT